MDSLEITVQYRRGEDWPVVAEWGRPGELAARAEGLLGLPADWQARLTAWSLDTRAYGTFLGEALLRDAIRDLFRTARAAAGSVGLRVLLVVEDPDLKSLHWERLCGPNGRSGWDLLALDQRTPLSRYLPSLTDRHFPAIGRRDLRALVVLADPRPDNPYGLAHFDAVAGAPRIAAVLGEIPHDLLGPLPGAAAPASLDALAEHLTAGPYTLLHLVSHGQVRADGETIVYLLDAAGQVAPVTATDLIERLGRLGTGRGLPHLAFLATCEGASPEAEGALGGLAQRLIRDLGIPAVVAMTERVSIATAADLTAAFYTRLRVHGQPDLALVEARPGLQGRADGLVPALFSRLGGQPLFTDRLDRPLTAAEMADALDRLAQLVPERAPVLIDDFERQVATLRATLGTDPAALSEPARQDRASALDGLDALSQEVLDLSFAGLALDQPIPVADLRCPFPGLNAFRTADRSFFFGREPLIHKLHDRLRVRRLLALLGNSGTGKSSLVLAGLIPAFVAAADPAGRRPGPDPEPTGQDSNAVRYLTPGADPETALARQLAAPLPEDRDSLLIVDQLEELFTLCTEPTRRVRFIAQLLAARQSDPRLHLVLILRADFWGDCAPYPALKDLMLSHQELIAPMPAADLRGAMEQQAAAVGLRFEADLSHQILAEVQGEPGAMPLLQHLLLELWHRRHGRWLRAAEYRALGGIKQAIAHTADDIYEGLKGDPAAQALVRNLFVRLTRLDEDLGHADQYRDTRHRVALPDLTPQDADPEQVRALVKRLADARLVVTAPDPENGEITQVEVSHEALIRHWPRLRGWLDEDRADLILVAAVREQARDWQVNGEREADLPRWGERLQQAETLFGQQRFAPTAVERRFLESTKALAQRERAEREEQQRQRVEALERAATEQRRRARSLWIGVLTASALLAIAVSFAFQKNLETRRAQENEREALYQTATVAWNNAIHERDSDPVKAAHYFARAAEHFARSAGPKDSANARLALKFIVERARLLRMETYTPEKKRTEGRDIAKLEGGAFSEDSTRLLTWSTRGPVRLWETTTGNDAIPPISIDVAPAIESKNAFGLIYIDIPITINKSLISPDGSRILLTYGSNAQLWNTGDGTAVAPPLKHEGDVKAARFSADGSRILTWAEDHTVRTWDSRTGAALSPPLKHDRAIAGATFSRDASRILTWTIDGTARLWAADTGEMIGVPMKLQSARAKFLAGDTRILTWSEKMVRFWDSWDGAAVSPPREIIPNTPGRVHDAIVKADPSADGSRVLMVSAQGAAYLFDSASGKALLPRLKGHPYGLGDAALSPDGSRIVTIGGWAGFLWDAATGYSIRALIDKKEHFPVSIDSIKFSKDGARFLAYDEYDGDISIRDSLTGHPLTPRFKHTGYLAGLTMRRQGPEFSCNFTEDLSRLLTWTEDTTRLWNTRSGDAVTLPLKPTTSITGSILSTDGSRILLWSDPSRVQTGADDITLWLWAVGDSVPPKASLTHNGPLLSAAFARDGNQPLTWRNRDSACRSALPPATVQTPTGLTLPWEKEESPTYRLDSGGGPILTWSKERAATLFGNSGQDIELLPSLTAKERIFGAEFSDDKTSVLTWNADGTARLWDTSTGRARIAPLHHGRWITGARLSRDGSRILTWGIEGTVRLWNSRTGQPVIAPLVHDSAVIGAQFSPDAKRIITWSGGGIALLWDGETGKVLTPPMRHPGMVQGALLSPDGSRIITFSDNRIARVWSAGTGEPLTPPLTHEATLSAAVFNDDGSRVLTWTDNGTARLWDSDTGNSLTPPMVHQGQIRGAQFSTDGSRLLTCSSDGTPRIWDTRTGQGVALHIRYDKFHLARDGNKLEGIELSRDGFPVMFRTRAQKGLIRDGSKFDGMQMSGDGSRVLTWTRVQTSKRWEIRADMGGESAFADQTSVGSVFAKPRSTDSVSKPGYDDSPFSEYSNRYEHGTIQLWDSRTGDAITPPLKLGPYILGAQFIANDTRIIAWNDVMAGKFHYINGSPPIGHFLADGRFIPDANIDKDSVRQWSLEPLDGYSTLPLAPNTPTSSVSQADAGYPPRTEGTVGDRARQDRAKSQANDAQPGATQRLANAPNSEDCVISTEFEVGEDGTGYRDGCTYISPSHASLLDISIDEQWPADKIVLRTEVETGTTMTLGGEVNALTVADWQRKRYCEYDAIRNDLKRLSEAEWAESQRRCRRVQGEARARP